MTTIEQLAGVPEAGVLETLANELFPDLTEGIQQVPYNSVSAEAVPEIDPSDLSRGY